MNRLQRKKQALLNCISVQNDTRAAISITDTTDFDESSGETVYSAEKEVNDDFNMV